MRAWSLALLAVLAVPVGAQATRAHPDAGNAPPTFPALLRAAQVGGSVRVQFGVDTAGRVVLESIRVLQSDNDLFIASLRGALTRWRFEPATRNGRAVPDTIEQEVAFTVPRERAVALAPARLLASTELAAGRYRMVIGWPAAAPVITALDSAATREVALAVLDTLVSSLVPAGRVPARIVCVGTSKELEMLPLDAAALERLARSGLGVVVTRRCPPVLASMIAVVDSNGKTIGAPPGEDPWMIEVLQVRRYATSIVLVEAAISQGTSTSYYRCRADYDEATAARWRAACEVSRMVVSSMEREELRYVAESTSR